MNERLLLAESSRSITINLCPLLAVSSLSDSANPTCLNDRFRRKQTFAYRQVTPTANPSAEGFFTSMEELWI